jgi:hypothetical protein
VEKFAKSMPNARYAMAGADNTFLLATLEEAAAKGHALTRKIGKI